MTVPSILLVSAIILASNIHAEPLTTLRYESVTRRLGPRSEPLYFTMSDNEHRPRYDHDSKTSKGKVPEPLKESKRSKSKSMHSQGSKSTESFRNSKTKGSMENKGSKMSSSSSSKKSKGLSKMSKSSRESKSMKSIKSRKSKSSKSKSSSSKSKDSKSMKSSKSKSSKSKSSKTKSSKKSKSHGNTADESIEDEEDLDVNNKVHYDVEGKALPSSVENSKEIEEGDSVATNSKGFMSASRVETWLLAVAILLAMTIMFVPRFFTAARATRPPDYAPIPISSAK